MSKLQCINSVIQIKSGRALFQKRCAFPQLYHIAKCCVHSTKDTQTPRKDDSEEFDKPIKFSTSKAAKFPAAYTKAYGLPTYQALIVSFSLSLFALYFGILREENDIDQKMVQNIPTELLEQIYGKERAKVKAGIN
ncbi:hypothetical protein ANTQUA_LOCUS9210 [Anthophora quadrimaculata]